MRIFIVFDILLLNVRKINEPNISEIAPYKMEST